MYLHLQCEPVCRLLLLLRRVCSGFLFLFFSSFVGPSISQHTKKRAVNFFFLLSFTWEHVHCTLDSVRPTVRHLLSSDGSSLSPKHEIQIIKIQCSYAFKVILCMWVHWFFSKNGFRSTWRMYSDWSENFEERRKQNERKNEIFKDNLITLSTKKWCTINENSYFVSWFWLNIPGTCYPFRPRTTHYTYCKPYGMR